MPFSHHSHSGQFCAHAENTLEEVVQQVISKGFRVLALTEHIYRPEEDFYPEEQGVYTAASLKERFSDYVVEACRLQHLYSSKIQIIIGFEAEWIRPSSEDDIRDVLSQYAGTIQMFLGSVHHVLGCPIDFDREKYEQAREKAGGTDEQLFLHYFTEMNVMLRALNPPVVGHFDLIRLKSDSPNTQFEGMEAVWERIRDNLEYIASYGGILELNSAALRKGLAEPYPCMAVCQHFLSLGGRFTISDDSHGIAQVGTHYNRLLEFIQRVGIKEIWYADPTKERQYDTRFCGFSSIAVRDLERDPIWSAP
ncbi:histidinol phosphate phosphatase H [Westerdykella ornata]|uniref:Histidinol-phosphatase n=1 Tax=Westerdykella ornata TaxID=318751 RepID=A0A6A6JHU9_WESOR|nr:histidinol phosphate phosphatase H [Westerdykella ornata]KAF2275663.1 histidinol phosphate phosphatase H [Westerdykella ornata]